MHAIKPLVVSAPFGNYIQPECATATLGTYTAAARPGRLWRIIRTVRYYHRLGAWVNKIGLRNPGIDDLQAKAGSGRISAADKILSIHGFSSEDWWKLLEGCKAIRPMAVELNISCPNVGEMTWPKDLFSRAIATGLPIVVKIPPVRYRRILEEAAGSGVRWLHCCNTLPVPAGGMSGRPLLPISLRVVWEVRQWALQSGLDELRIIGGGGVMSPEDAAAYRAAGADVVAVGTRVFGPRYLSRSHTERVLRPIAEAAGRDPEASAGDALELGR